tara:strand:+ start:1058 stop:1552 length:495 start_codon:yes stop_codon:yes gene_type:complete
MFKTFASAEFKHSYIETSCWPFTSFYVTQMQELIKLYKKSIALSNRDKTWENKFKALQYFTKQSWGIKSMSKYTENEKTAWTQILGSKKLASKEQQDDIYNTVHWLRHQVQRQKGGFINWIKEYSNRGKIDTPAKELKEQIVNKAIDNLKLSLNIVEDFIQKKY